ncbi:MAG: hypothetical protein GW903_02200 [Alphaproteobacteria bacterium]|nr:hypothetical protein [Alphaproteobacteria bacterium]NCQ87783.1 hypothetical protein [Alphaproteobacteria bacterium]NCT05709.1 hypothetical protein [Alphaproteobacteria bacterium]
MGIKNWVMAGLGLAGATAVGAQILDDGIEGCLEINGRAHFQMDDGSISENPIGPLQFTDDGASCIVSHGGGSAPDVYPLLNSQFAAARLATELAGNTTAEFQALETNNIESGIITPYDSVEAVFEGGEVRFFDEAGEEVPLQPMAVQFADAIHHVYRGDETHPDGPQADTDELGTAVVVHRSDAGPLVAVAIPARRM